MSDLEYPYDLDPEPEYLPAVPDDDELDEAPLEGEIVDEPPAPPSTMIVIPATGVGPGVASQDARLRPAVAGDDREGQPAPDEREAEARALVAGDTATVSGN